MPKDRFNKVRYNEAGSGAAIAGTRRPAMFQNGKTFKFDRKQSKCVIEDHQIPEVAELYFVYKYTLAQLAEHFGVSQGTMHLITTATTHSRAWADAVVGLIERGEDVTRRETAKAKAKKAPKKEKKAPLTDDEVRDIRKRAESGEKYTTIGEDYGYKPGSIGPIVRGLNYAHVRD